MNNEKTRVKKINRASGTKNMCRAILHGCPSLFHLASYFFLLSAPLICISVACMDFFNHYPMRKISNNICFDIFALCDGW